MAREYSEYGPAHGGRYSVGLIAVVSALRLGPLRAREIADRTGVDRRKVTQSLTGQGPSNGVGRALFARAEAFRWTLTDAGRQLADRVAADEREADVAKQRTGPAVPSAEADELRRLMKAEAERYPDLSLDALLGVLAAAVVRRYPGLTQAPPPALFRAGESP